MSETILRPDEVRRFETISKYVLFSSPLLLTFFLMREVKFDIDILTIGIFSGFFVVLLGILYLLWKILLWVTRKRFKSVYLLLVVIWVISSISDVMHIFESIEAIGLVIWICYFLTSMYSLYLLLTKKFRDWIFAKT